MKRLCVTLFAGLVLAGCNTSKQEEEDRKHLEAVRNHQHELDAKTQALSDEVDWMRKRLRELEGAREAEERKLEGLQQTLVQSWRGDPAALQEHMKSAEVPQALEAPLRKAQERQGNIAPERLFAEGVDTSDLKKVSSALESWELNTGVTALPAQQEPSEEENSCERAEVTISCLPLPLGSAKDQATQLCRMSQADSVWVLRSDQGSLVRVNLLGSRHDRYRAVRMFSPEVWLLAGEDDSPTSPGSATVSAKSWLEVFKVSGGSEHSRQGILRHALPLERQGQKLAQAELDLDGDGSAELLVLDGKELHAVHYDRRHDEAEQWSEAEVCPLIEKRTEKELEPARAPCTAWAQAKPTKDSGAH